MHRHFRKARSGGSFAQCVRHALAEICKGCTVGPQLAEHITLRSAVVVYWFNLLLLGLMLLGSVRYAWRAGLIKGEMTATLRSTHERRIIIYQVLYAIGTALCIINTYVSIAFILLLQLNSVFAPRIRPLNQV